MPKLSDTQLVILSAAARRDDRAVLPLSKSLRNKGAAAAKTLEALRKRGLLEERPAAADADAWREAGNGRRMTLVITEAGLRALDGSPAGEASKKSTPAQPRARKPRAGRKAATKPRDKTPAPLVRPGTKQALLVDLLKRKRGATIDEIAEATGWQAHSVRGAISGALKKKLGLDVTSETVKGRGRVYRIAARG